jgi:peptidoglycan/LPS O-acetylase OafA/YrhL
MGGPKADTRPLSWNNYATKLIETAATRIVCFAQRQVLAGVSVLNKIYAPSLDGLRAICIIFTVFYHTPGCPRIINGTVGVDVFFALSGWLITWLLLEDRRKHGDLNLRTFYIRRVFRIMPIYYGTVVLYIAAAVLLAKITSDSSKLDNLRNALVYLLTFNREYAPPEAGNFVGHAWTLGIEEKFYLVWPLILLMQARSVAAVLITVLISFSPSLDLVIRGYFGLGFGAALAVWLHGSQRARTMFEVRPIANAAALALVIPYSLSVLIPSEFVWNVVISAIASVMIGSIWLNPKQSVAKVLSITPLPWLGTLTYSIYMLHVLCVNFCILLFAKLHIAATGLTLFACVYGISILAAWLANVTIERPFIRLGRRLAAAASVNG